MNYPNDVYRHYFYNLQNQTVELDFYPCSTVVLDREHLNFIDISAEKILEIGDLERGFENELPFGLEQAQTLKLTFNLAAFDRSYEYDSIFYDNLLGIGTEIVAGLPELLAIPKFYAPFRAVMKKNGTPVFDGVLVQKRQNKLTVKRGIKQIECEFIDTFRYCCEQVKFEKLWFWVASVLGKDYLRSAVIVNRYLNDYNIVNHNFVNVGQITFKDYYSLFNALGRLLNYVYRRVTRQVDTDQEMTGNTDTLFASNPLRCAYNDTNLGFKPFLGWTFYRQNFEDRRGGKVPSTALTELRDDQLFFMARALDKDASTDLQIGWGGFLSDESDTETLSHYTNLYEFLKAWCSSFMLKARWELFDDGRFWLQTKRPLDGYYYGGNVNGKIALSNLTEITADYETNFGSIAANFNCTIEKATGNNEGTISILNGSDSDTSMESNVVIHNGAKSASSDTAIRYATYGWDYVLQASNMYSAILFDATNDVSSMNIGVFNTGNTFVHEHTFSKVNEICRYSLNDSINFRFEAKPEEPEFLIGYCGGEAGSGYFSDAYDNGFPNVNEGDARRESKIDLFNAYAHELNSSVGMPNTINRIYERLLFSPKTELLNIEAHAMVDFTHLGFVVTDSIPLGIEVIDNANRYGIITKVSENVTTGTAKITIFCFS